MAVVKCTQSTGRARRFCALAVRLAICLVAVALIAVDVAGQDLSVLTAVGLILWIEHRGVATSILHKGAALRHFLRDDH